jgi:hypothetical protein
LLLKNGPGGFIRLRLEFWLVGGVVEFDIREYALIFYLY